MYDSSNPQGRKSYTVFLPIVPTTTVPQTTTTEEVTTPCQIVEGMDEPMFIPSDMIITDNDDANDDIDKIRPAKGPLVVDVNKLVVRIWLHKPIRISSVELVTPKNVDYFEVTYIRPTNSRPVRANANKNVSGIAVR